jgi:4'-phosphopantetheinyl transferase
VIPPGEAHLFTVRLAEATDPGLLAAYRDLLSDDERARGDRYLFERNRHEHVVAHALKRLCLSRYAGVDPRAWRFVVGERGKPEIAEPASALRFNLSHTDGLVACLVAEGIDVGVDVETTARRTDTDAIASRFFAEPEVAALLALPASEHKRRFFEYWTLKEAYIKARGLGLAIPLGDFWFTLAPGAPPAIGLAPALDDRPERWRFFQGELAPCFQMAAAVEVKDVEPRLVWVDRSPPDPRAREMPGA